MGFDAGIYKVKRYDNNITPKNIYVIEHYLGWENNDWAKEHFNTPIEYAKYHCDTLEVNNLIPSEEALNFYRNTLHDNGYGSVIYDEMLYFGRPSGTNIHDWFIEHLGKNFEKGISNENIELQPNLISDITKFLKQSEKVSKEVLYDNLKEYRSKAHKVPLSRG